MGKLLYREGCSFSHGKENSCSDNDDHEVCFGAGYNVGESDGWTIGVDYNQWASTKKFQVSDTLGIRRRTCLFFNYITMLHNVLQVTKQDYESCNVKSPVATFASGRDSITLDKAGHSYFACGFPGHCRAGLRVAISAGASSSQSPDVPSPPSTPREIPPPRTPSAPCQPNFQPPPSGFPNVPLPPAFPNFGTPSGPGFPYLPPFGSGASLHSSNLNAAMLGVIMPHLFAVFAH
ncbi:hypothetical protein DKX38_003971 [Salix brachista]|uniref:Phytocyanin domain-containing protein n=1 Tax=Salix brachista TaxID=2182728 RepID=A0A5N5NA88_9ROSI|nr:hypothetical protein DKX38_003971 [Salix brachista]